MPFRSVSEVTFCESVRPLISDNPQINLYVFFLSGALFFGGLGLQRTTRRPSGRPSKKHVGNLRGERYRKVFQMQLKIETHALV